MIVAKDVQPLSFAFLVFFVIMFFTWVHCLIGSVRTEGVKPITHRRLKLNSIVFMSSFCSVFKVKRLLELQDTVIKAKGTFGVIGDAHQSV